MPVSLSSEYSQKHLSVHLTFRHHFHDRQKRCVAESGSYEVPNGRKIKMFSEVYASGVLLTQPATLQWRAARAIEVQDDGRSKNVIPLPGLNLRGRWRAFSNATCAGLLRKSRIVFA
jgi:hypothetical protein